jgi:hypothetical protein
VGRDDVAWFWGQVAQAAMEARWQDLRADLQDRIDGC